MMKEDYEIIKMEELEGEAKVKLDRKAPVYCTDCDIEIDEREAQEMKISFDGRDYLIRFPKVFAQTLSKKSSVKLLPVSKDEFLLKIL